MRELITFPITRDQQLRAVSSVIKEAEKNNISYRIGRKYITIDIPFYEVRTNKTIVVTDKEKKSDLERLLEHLENNRRYIESYTTSKHALDSIISKISSLMAE